MARTTKQLSGPGKDKFLRGLIASEHDIPADAATALGERMCNAIADVRVRRDIWEESRQAPAVDPASIAATGSTESPVSTEPPPAEAAQPTSSASQSTSAPTDPAATDAVAFDPFAFSALAVLTKKGRTALAEQLDKIENAEHLHAIATAQHLAVDANLVDVSSLREAMIAATEARLAERRAAAS